MSVLKILVLGGTRYFGKRLVRLLIDQGYQVTIATRGQTNDSFGAQVERLHIDRNNLSSLQSAAQDRSWDVLVDQICYSPNDAEFACSAFKNRVGRIVHVSTGSVYLKDDSQKEADFDPWRYPIRMGAREDFDYGEGKRLAEAVYFQRWDKPITAVRIPIVLGSDDYSGRLEFHIDRVKQERPIVVPNLEAETSFISSGEAAEFLLWAVSSTFVGSINACSDGTISMRGILQTVEKTVGGRAKVSPAGPEDDATPFAGPVSRYLDNRLAKKQGFKFRALSEWLPSLVEELAARQT